MQYQAGYILDGIREILIDHFKNDKDYIFRIDGLLHSLSYFEIETNADIEYKIDINPLFYVANNLVTRGHPTRPSLNLAKRISEILEFARIEKTEIGEIKFINNEIESGFKEKIFSALHIIDPKLTTEYQETAYRLGHFNNLGSDAEKNFIFKFVKHYIGDYFTQLLETQKSIDKTLEFAKYTDGKTNKFRDKHFLNLLTSYNRQNVDFSIEFPYSIVNKNGIIVEVDGRQHHEIKAQKQLDIQRNEALNIANYSVLRIKTTEFNIIKERLQGLINLSEKYEYFQHLKENFNNPLYETEQGKDALQLALSPFAIARLQKTIIEFILSGTLKLNAEKWKICVIERDVPCAFLAIEDLMQLLNNLFSLANVKINLPKIELVTITNEKFKNSKINIATNPDYITIDEIEKYELGRFDLLMDISVLRRNGFEIIKENIEADYKVKIRSSHSIKTKKKFYTSSLIPYPEIGKQEDEKFQTHTEKQNILEYFLQNIFRKQSFRPGQLPILDRALQGKSVIGLLPTGGGKSLTYQLAALLQAGISLIIDPIKSLMKDQNDGLKRNLIDATVFINSSLKTAEERTIATKKLKNAEVLFCFISPERMQIAEFRRNLQEMHHNYKSYFSYCIVDEAHCVSEWGHDFRTSYLRLGDNARVFCKPKSGIIPLFGLTATASFDVLTDVQRELDISDEDVVRDDPSNRDELSFKIVKINVDDIEEEDPFKFKEKVGKRKHEEIINIIKSVPEEIIERTEYANKNFTEIHDDKDFIPTDFSELNFYSQNSKQEYLNSGLIFCPHKSIKIKSGVASVVNSLEEEVESKKLSLKIGYFYGSGDDDDYKANSKEELIVEQHQTNFVQNKSSLLVATKAFGMGIDKPNIRYTIHYNYPNSIESFIQEAGRAGRDRKTAINYILYSSKPEIDRSILLSFFENAFRGRNKEVLVLFELLTEITFPYASASNTIYTELESEFGVNVYFSFYPKEKPFQIYINEEFQKGYGCIDLRNKWSINTQRKHFSFTNEAANEILNYSKTYIENNCKDKANVVNWLKEQKAQANKDGIEKKLEKIAVNETIDITIGFQNNKLFLIQELLQEIDTGYTFPVIKDAVKFCKSGDEFISKLQTSFWKATGNNADIPLEYHKNIKSYFNNIRDNSDTSRAIYRLSIIGVIDDYEVDYNSKTYLVKITKRENDYYVNKLYDYFTKYISKQRAEKLISKITTGEAVGKTIIQKCLNLLTHFVYNEVVEKRKEAIKSMEFAVELGLDGHDGHEKMREHIQLYFNAKYLRDYEIEGKIYNLLADTENGKDYSLSILWKYLNVTFGNIENLKHLLGSAERLLNENRKNAALLLMKSFALILLNVSPKGKIKNQRFIKEAEDIFIEGVFIFSDEKNEYDAVIKGFKKHLTDYNPETIQVIENILETLSVKALLNPLREFNNKFLKKYETRKHTINY